MFGVVLINYNFLLIFCNFGAECSIFSVFLIVRKESVHRHLLDADACALLAFGWNALDH